MPKIAPVTCSNLILFEGLDSENQFFACQLNSQDQNNSTQLRLTVTVPDLIWLNYFDSGRLLINSNFISKITTYSETQSRAATDCIEITQRCYPSKSSIGHMSQTGPKKCFMPQNCEKYTNFDSTDHSLLYLHSTPIKLYIVGKLIFHGCHIC